MSTKTVEVLASHDGRGVYDLPFQTRLVRRDGKHYLVHDWYCGEGQLRGGQYRPHVYKVPDSLVAEYVDLISNYEDWDDRYKSPTRKGSVLEHIIPDLGPSSSLGEQGDLKWTSEL